MKFVHTAHTTFKQITVRHAHIQERTAARSSTYGYSDTLGTPGAELARPPLRVRSPRPAHIAESSQHMPHCTLGSPARSPDPTARTRAFLAIAMTHLRAQLCRASRPPTTHVASPAHHAARRGIPSSSHAPPSCTSRDRAWVRCRGRQDAPPPPLPPHTPHTVQRVLKCRASRAPRAVVSICMHLTPRASRLARRPCECKCSPLVLARTRRPCAETLVGHH